MNPRKSKWLKKYIQDSRYFPQAEKFKDIYSNENIAGDIDKFLYLTLQPTGLMYGYPIEMPNVFRPSKSKWGDRDKMKVILSESFFRCALFCHKNEILETKDLNNFLNQLFFDVGQYYQETFDEFRVVKRSFFRIYKPGLKLTEHILNQRINIKFKIRRNFWNSFFQNSLLFIDIYYFAEWYRAKDKAKIALKIKREREYFNLQILKIIACAAHVDGIIQKEEKTLFNHFLDSSDLSSEKTSLAKRYLNNKVRLEQIDIKWVDSWLLKKYLLEIAILTVWSDKVITDSEQEFLHLLTNKLQLPEEALHASMMAIESFILENWKQVHYLQPNQNFFNVRKMWIEEMMFIADKYKKSIVQEIQESKELINLIQKSSSAKLSNEEKDIVKTQLIDILKMLPTVTFLILPGRTLTVPILLKILPKNAFPSAFQKHLEEDENSVEEIDNE